MLYRTALLQQAHPTIVPASALPTAGLICCYCCCLITPPPIEERSIVMSVSVCLCVCVCVFVCPRSCLRNYTPRLHQIFMLVTYGRDSVFPWRRTDTLFTSGFLDDVIFAHKPRLLDVAAQLERSAQCTRSLGLSYKLCALIPVAGQRTHGTTFRAFKVTSQVATPGAESAVYDCLVFASVGLLFL